jgi:chromosomal replication initiator protein
MMTSARWISLSENRTGRAALERVAACVSSRGPRRVHNPLFLHGPAGTGKTRLVSDLIGDVTRRVPDLSVALLSAGDCRAAEADGACSGLAAARQVDLIVVEDLQHLSPRVSEAFGHLVDRCLSRERQMVFTALVGPGELVHLPARLTSRLGAGLVVGLEVLSPASRLAFLEEEVAGRGLPVEQPVLAWLAEHLPGSVRQLQGAITRLEAVACLHEGPPSLEMVVEMFRPERDSRQATVERIARQVGRYFQVEPEHLQSRARSRHALLARQIGMYLARQLTGLSLQQIGAYFGGRDHSTVLHACRKVEQALGCDATLSGAVRRLHADLA